MRLEHKQPHTTITQRLYSYLSNLITTMIKTATSPIDNVSTHRVLSDLNSGSLTCSDHRGDRTTRCKGQRTDSSRCENNVKGSSYCHVHVHQKLDNVDNDKKITYKSRRKVTKLYVHPGNRNNTSMQCLGTKNNYSRCCRYGTPNDGLFYLCSTHQNQKETIEKDHVRCKVVRKCGSRCRGTIERNDHSKWTKDEYRLDYTCPIHQMKKTKGDDK